MKATVMFKTPDVTEYAIEDAIRYVDSEDEKEEIKAKLEAVFKKFIEYGECISIEFDTDTQTAVVVK